MRLLGANAAAAEGREEQPGRSNYFIGSDPAGWRTGDVVEVEGALQRRFWRTGAGTASRYEVNCRRGRKVARGGVGAEHRMA